MSNTVTMYNGKTGKAVSCGLDQKKALEKAGYHADESKAAKAQKAAKVEADDAAEAQKIQDAKDVAADKKAAKK